MHVVFLDFQKMTSKNKQAEVDLNKFPEQKIEKIFEKFKSPKTKNKKKKAGRLNVKDRGESENFQERMFNMPDEARVEEHEQDTKEKKGPLPIWKRFPNNPYAKGPAMLKYRRMRFGKVK